MDSIKTVDVLVVLGNLALFAILAYAVFVLGNSGWWMASLVFFRFGLRGSSVRAVSVTVNL